MKDPDVPSLVQGLREGGARREAAIARLTIAGKRAVARLVDAYQNTDDREVQVAILRVLEAVGDERALIVAQQALAARGDVAVAGVAVLRELLGRPEGSADVKALDVLLAVARDGSAERRVRVAAIGALEQAPPDVRHALGTLAVDQSPDGALWEDAIAGQLPDDPKGLREAIADRASAAALADLRRLIEAVGVRERTTGRKQGQEWLAVRGAIHQALALRGSRIALYDLRETFERSEAPLPSSFLGALQTIGDDSCLEPLAAAFSRARSDARWQHQLTHAFHEIVKRERITKRHSALRRALAKAPGLGG
jgi:HEAT repeat protein